MSNVNELTSVPPASDSVEEKQYCVFENDTDCVFPEAREPDDGDGTYMSWHPADTGGVTTAMLNVCDAALVSVNSMVLLVDVSVEPLYVTCHKVPDGRPLSTNTALYDRSIVERGGIVDVVNTVVDEDVETDVPTADDITWALTLPVSCVEKLVFCSV
jgi:hypothetical protein